MEWFLVEKKRVINRMPCCRICGEIKQSKEFQLITYFSRYKKHKVIWCRDCQKMWVDAKREKEYADKYLNSGNFTVSFD